MPAQVFGSGATATQLYLAFNGVAPSNAIYTNWKGVIDTSGESALALQLGQATANTSSATLAASVLANLGVSASTTNAEAFAALSAAVVQLFDAYPATSRGQIVLNMVKLLSGLEGNATYGTAAANFNTATTSAYTYASNPDNTSTGGTGTGTTFTLTTGIDNIVGTSGDDVIIGDNSGASATVTAGDQVNGGTGTDTFKFYTATGVAVVAPTLSAVENLFVSGNDTSDINTSAGSFAAINRLIVDNAGGTKTYTLGAADTFALQNTAGATGANVVFSSSDSATTVTLDAVGTSGANGAVDLKGTNLAAVTLAVANKNYIELNNSAGATITKTVNVTGSGTLLLDAAANTLTGITKVDASANTGGVTFVAPTSKLTFTGGSGNDEVRLAATTFTADDKLAGGDGTDVIQVNDTGINAAANDVVKGINASTGFETLALAATGSTVDFDLITASGITNVRVDVGAGAQTLNNATNATIVEVAAGIALGANDLTIANKLGQTTTNIKLDATSSGASSVTQLVLTGVSDIKVESDFAGTGAQATANELTVTGQADNSIFTVTGDHALKLTLKSAATSVGSTVNASGLTKALTVVGTDKADSITGGSGSDSFLGNTDGAAAGADTFTGGAGNDTFKFDALSVGVANMATITDFTKGDKLVLDNSGGAGAFVATKVDVSAAATLADAVGLADGTDNNVTWFNFGGNTYVVSAGGTTSAITEDTIVKLTGVLDLSTSTYVAGTDTLTFA